MKHATHAQPRVHDEAIAELTQAGYSANQIATRLNVTSRTVQRARVRTGSDQPAHPNAGRRYTPEMITEFEARIQEGWSLTEIARSYGVCAKHLFRRFRGRGWTLQQAGQLAVARKAEIRLYRVLDNQHRNATHLMPLADQLCQAGDAFETSARQSHTVAPK